VKKHGRYAVPPTADDLTRYYHLNDDDLTQITSCRGEPNRLGFALQLTTVRYLGTFLDDPVAVPSSVLETLSRQLGLANRDDLETYRSSKQLFGDAEKADKKARLRTGLRGGCRQTFSAYPRPHQHVGPVFIRDARNRRAGRTTAIAQSGC
jgi:hypothetical protein